MTVIIVNNFNRDTFTRPLSYLLGPVQLNVKEIFNIFNNIKEIFRR